MAEPTSCCTVPGGYCERVDTLFNLAGVHVIDMAWRPPERGRERLVLRVETSPGPAGCPGCGVLAAAHGRRVRRLQDIPAFGAPVERAGADKLTARQVERIEAGLQAGDPTFEVTVAWRCYQQLRSAFHTTLAEGQTIALAVLESFPSCAIPEIARPRRTLQAWRDQLLAYFTTSRANNGGTEAVNGIIELHRRIARGFRNPTNYRLRMILAAGRLTHPNLR